MRRFAWVLLLVSLFLCGIISCAEADALTVRADRPISGYTENEIGVYAPESGTLTLTVLDEYNTYLRIDRQVNVGEQTILWDGLARNEERLLKKRYTLRAELTGESGAVMNCESTIEVTNSSAAVVYALPSSETYYRGRDNEWFLEYRLSMDGDMEITFETDGNDRENFRFVLKNQKGNRCNTCSFGAMTDNNPLPEGTYRVTVKTGGADRYAKSFDLCIKDMSPVSDGLFLTGNIMPDRDATDDEIWDLMMRSSVVADIGVKSHLSVYAEMNEKSEVLGTLHGQTQAMEVKEIAGEWTRIAAWNHESGSPVEGWVRTDKLRIAEPSREYGLLLDKKEQTMTLYHLGKRVDTVLVSTGKMAKNELYQETSAGSFLTDVHMQDYSTNGLKYDYVIRYDGGNMLHQIPYEWGTDKKNFLAGSVYLGAKASHACIRIQAEPGENGMNAYWIWTHIPYHTRLIILDDPEEREADARVLTGETDDYFDLLVNGWRVISEEEHTEDDGILMTFGGDMVLGARESYYNSKMGLPYYLEQYGTQYFLSGLKSVFENDDWTVINLEGVLKETGEGEDMTKQWRFRGLPEYVEVLTAGSVEMVNIANNHTIDYGETGYASTMQALKGKVEICGNGQNTVVSVKGHMIGFGGCRETTYLSDPDIIARDVLELKDAGAEYIVYQCHWGTEYDTNHNTLQEAMARACQRAGVDLVIGHHPHIPQGIGMIGDMPVVYSLGNLMFGGTINLKTYDGMLVQTRLTWNEEKGFSTKLTLIPVLTSSGADRIVNTYQPVFARGDDWKRVIRTVQSDTGFFLTDRVLPEER